ncbi:uncharacterized protein LOC130806904 isoform X3 [Amaranthus tricolor]|uniref:uncharacterized protein LOC130806904 isoform X3 n=1 Tax=Amaranthus tricolor TaxID=29722 RepID=UPI002585DE5A|nr:uncharacterized protein LOC130806904 isoform X3 [Amaranthus tricolor]
MADEKPETYAIVAIDTSNDFSYLVCSVCEKPLHNPTFLCNFCNAKAFNTSSFGSKRLFRILMSIASDTRVFKVICFDRAAKVLFGCSADEFFHFAKFHPFSEQSLYACDSRQLSCHNKS